MVTLDEDEFKHLQEYANTESTDEYKKILKECLEFYLSKTSERPVKGRNNIKGAN
jgi:hypothetical protein